MAAVLGLASTILWAAPARGDDSGFVLNNGGTDGRPGGTPYSGLDGNYPQAFAGVEISATPDPASRRYVLQANESGIPVSWDFWPHDPVTGTSSFSMSGFYDPVANRATGTFTIDQQASGAVHHGTDVWPVNFTLAWEGNVTGSVVDNVADFAFSGTNVITCTIVGGGTDGADDDCSENFVQSVRVWFDINNANYLIVPGSNAAPEQLAVLVSGPTGDVYFSPADQADREPAARTWQPIEPGNRLMLEEGVMLRTGINSSLKVQFASGPRFRLGPSTLFEVRQLTGKSADLADVFGRLYSGIADFYMEAWADSGKHFEVETDRANTSIKGTTYHIAVTDTTTVVTVIEGVVTVTHTGTGQSVDVAALERATVDAAGVTKMADPAASMPPEDADPLAGPDSQAAGGGLPPVEVLVAAGAVLLLMAAVALFVLRRATRRQPL